MSSDWRLLTLKLAWFDTVKAVGVGESGQTKSGDCGDEIVFVGEGFGDVFQKDDEDNRDDPVMEVEAGVF